MTLKNLTGARPILLLIVILAAAPACSQSAPRSYDWPGQKVSGRVVYKDEPVPYGYVVFYHVEKSFDLESGGYAPTAAAQIINGRYEAVNVMPGPTMVCVVTDPDADVSTLTAPRFMAMEPPRSVPKGGAPAVYSGSKDFFPEHLLHEEPLPAPVDPAVEKLTDAQKQALKQIHRKYGIVGKSPLDVFVEQGEQTYDIILK